MGLYPRGGSRASDQTPRVTRIVTLKTLGVLNVPNRREFVQHVGITIASLVAANAACTPFSGGEDDSPREHLRSCWHRFDWLARLSPARR
jgi:hypothetical protein